MHEEKTFESNTPVVKIIERTPSDTITTELYIYYDCKKRCYNVIGRKNSIGDFKYIFDSKKILRNFVKLILDDDYSSSITLHNYVLFRKFKNLSIEFLKKSIPLISELNNNSVVLLEILLQYKGLIPI